MGLSLLTVSLVERGFRGIQYLKKLFRLRKLHNDTHEISKTSLDVSYIQLRKMMSQDMRTLHLQELDCCRTLTLSWCLYWCYMSSRSPKIPSYH